MATVVLLPGLDGTGASLASFIASLSAIRAPVVVAYPPDQALSYSELVSYVRGKLPQGPIVLVGESFSGPVAIELAATTSSSVVALVLVCSFCGAPHRIPAVMRRLITSLPLWLVPSALLARVVFGSGADAATTAPFRASVSQVQPHVWRARLRSVLEVDVGHLLQHIRIPMLYLCATRDLLVPRSATRKFLSGAPSARLVEVSGPHFLLQARPAPSAHAIRSFVAEAGIAL